jgi:benzoylformate decarboxylase
VTTVTGIEAFLEVLHRSGVRHIFGNPGTTELPLNHALVGDHRFQYLFALQEIPVVTMAGGYAMASGHVGVANVHISCGLGNAMGMLYNAHCEGTPLVLTAGHQDQRLRMGEPVLEGDIVRVARPWTKWSAEVHRAQDIPTAVRRAIQTALTQPTGPVFLALPLDLQMEASDCFELSGAHVPDRHVRPPLEALRRAADILAAAKNPVILAGSRVMEAAGAAELTAVAERLGAPVYAEAGTAHGRLPMAADHPLYFGSLPLWSPGVHKLLAPFDVALAVGLNLLKMYLYQEPERAIPAQVRIVHLDSDPWQIGKNYPVELGLLGDPKAGLAELDDLLAERITPAAVSAAESRRKQYAARREAERRELLKCIDAERPRRPMTAMVLMEALARGLPPRAVVVEEAVTTHHTLLEKLGTFQDPSGHFAHRGWALGWGLGTALGVKLAWPDRPVAALLGDGAAMYGIQGLWSAAHHRIPVTFVIANNAQYQILKVCGDVMSLEKLSDPACPGMNLTDPTIDFVGLSRALGVEAQRVTEPDELTERLRVSLSGDKPLVLEVPVAG